MFQRTRTREPSIFTNVAEIWRIPVAPYKPQFQYRQTSSFTLTETMTDTITPGYRKIVRDGGVLPINAMTSLKKGVKDVGATDAWGYIGSYSNGDFDEGYQYRGQTSRLGFAAIPSFSADKFPVLDDAYVRRLYTAALANAKTRQMDFLTFYAEWHQTKDLVEGALSRTISRAFRLREQMRKRGIKKFSPREFADAWLEYRYGWRILAYDVEDIVKHVSRMHTGFLDRWRGKGEDYLSNTVRNQTSQNRTIFFDGGGIGGNMFENVTSVLEKHEIRTSVGVMIESVMRTYATIDPLITTYELVPYSFVVDWFFNINEYLQAVSPFTDSSILYAYSTHEFEKTLTFSTGPGPGMTLSNGYKIVPYGKPSPCTRSELSKVRALLNSDQQRAIVQYNNEFDSLKAADAFALIYGRLRTLRRFTTI